MSRPAEQFLISYWSLRKFVGLLGITLPLVLFAGGMIVFDAGLQTSLSAYYHTGMRDVFVGTICAIGVFLLTYRGNERKDDLAGNVACVCAVGLALFPTTPPDATGPQKAVGVWHFVFAAGFLLTLVYFSLVLFTKTGGNPTLQKRIRNRVYRICGWVMLACVVLIAAFKLFGYDAWLVRYSVVFWLETTAIVAFGVSWLVKGEAILGDKADKDPVATASAAAAGGS